MKHSMIGLGIAAALLLAGCETAPTGTTLSSPPAALGYAYDAKLGVATAWLAYLNSGKADPAVVAKVQPLYVAASVALRVWTADALSGTASATEPSSVTTAFAALTAAMVQYHVSTAVQAS